MESNLFASIPQMSSPSVAQGRRNLGLNRLGSAQQSSIAPEGDENEAAVNNPLPDGNPDSFEATPAVLTPTVPTPTGPYPAQSRASTPGFEVLDTPVLK